MSDRKLSIQTANEIPPRGSYAPSLGGIPKQTRLITLKFSSLFIFLTISFSSFAFSQPNIVFILADDLGVGDVGAYGGKVIETPHIDALASGGALFSQAYATHPVCSPSRAGLMSGRYQQRHGWEFNPAGRDRNIGMDDSQITLAEMLQDAGYTTSLIGKWHLGYLPTFHPLNRGFDKFFGVLAGGSIFIDQSRPDVESVGDWPLVRTESNGIHDQYNLVRIDDYLTDAFTEQSVEFIKHEHEKPFFLFLSHTTPHTPLQATKKYTARYKHLKDPTARVYAAMVASLDESVGAIVNTLSETKRLKDTLIVFSSDNGCAGYIGVCSNGELSGFKRYHNEGGIRIPLILHWPSQIKPGKYPKMVSLLDLMATFAEVAGSKHSTEDSVDLIRFLKNPDGNPHKYLYWRSSPTRAIRDDRWKLLEYAKSSLSIEQLDAARRVIPPKDGWPRQATEGYLTLLYDLENDPGETKNLAKKYPGIVSRLQEAYDKWNKELPEESILPAMRSTLFKIDGQTVQLIF